MKRSKFVLFTIVLLTTLLVSGCWDRKELNDVAVLLVTAFDKSETSDEYEIEVLIAAPSGMDGGSMTVKAGNEGKMPIMLKGKDLDKIRIDEERQLSRSLITSHRRVVVIGESLARRGIRDILDQISRNPKNRLKTYLLVARQTRASSLVEMDYPLDPTPGEFLRELIKIKMNTPSSLREIFISSTTPGIEPVAASFSKRKAPKDKAPKDKASLDSIAIFRDFKLVGFVEDLEAVALNGLLGKKPFGVIKVHLKDAKGSISIQLDKLKVRRKVQISQKNPSFTFKVQVIGRISDNRTNIDLSNPKYIDKMNQVLELEIKQLYESLFHKLQHDFEADSAGLGTMIYKKDPKLWKEIEKDWQTIYKEQKINWKVRANITGVGSAGADLFLPENKLVK